MQNITEYAKYAAAAGLAEDTINTYTGHLTRLYRFLSEKGYPAEAGNGDCLITRSMLNDFNMWLYDRNLKAETRNNYKAAISKFFDFLVKLGRAEKDCSVIIPYSKTTFNPRIDGKTIYTTEELTRFLAALRRRVDLLGRRDYAFSALALGTALRASELCSLTTDDLEGIMDGRVWVKGKGGNLEDVAVARFVRAPLNDYMALRPQHSSTNKLFVTRIGSSLNRKQAHDHISQLQRENGLISGIHILRHLTLTLLEPYGRAMVRDVARHSSRGITDHYTHTSIQSRIDAIGYVYEKPFEGLLAERPASEDA